MDWFKKLLLCLVFLVLASGCSHCICPAEKTCLVVGDPITGAPRVLCFEEGEFDKSDKERGWEAFDSPKKAWEHIREILSRKRI